MSVGREVGMTEEKINFNIWSLILVVLIFLIVQGIKTKNKKQTIISLVVLLLILSAVLVPLLFTMFAA